MAGMSLDAKRMISGSVVLHVRMKRVAEFSIRLWIARVLIELAGKIAWMRVRIDNG